MNQHCHWGAILPLLGAKAAGTLPARASCPLCARDSLQVYRDQADGGQWYRCAACGFAGDAIQLAARRWGLGVPATLLRLEAAGVAFPGGATDGAAAAYLAEVAGPRAAAAQLWAEAAKGGPVDAGLAAFSRGLGIPAIRPRDWAKRGGQFVGTIDHRRVIELLQSAKKRNKAGEFFESGGHKIFRGVGWGRVLVVPFRDLPGRISGFLFVGREGRDPEDFAFRRVPARHGSAVEDGVAMLEAVAGRRAAGQVAFACTDALAAVRLQLAHLAAHSTPLPLAGTRGDAPSAAWDAVDGPAVAFGPRDTPAEAARLVRLARRLGGGCPTPKGRRPVDTLAAAGKAAAGWEALLEGELGRRAPDEAEEVFLRVGLPSADARRFLAGCTPAIRAQADPAGSADAVRTATVGTRPVVEAEGAWRDARTGELISDVLVRVDRAVHRKSTGRVAYEGRLVRGGAEIPFVVTPAADPRGPAVAAWLRRECVAGGLGVPVAAPRWCGKLFQLAQLFAPPAVEEADGVTGWDDARNAFAFPAFGVAAGGGLLPGSGPADPAAGARFAAPGGLPPDAIAALSRPTPAVRTFWAAAAAVATAALAPRRGRVSGSVALCGRAVRHVIGTAADAFGCPRAAIGRQAGAAVARVLDVQRACTWPTFADAGAKPAGAIAADLPPGVLCHVGGWTGQYLAMLGDWTAIVADDPGITALPFAAWGGPVMANYLRHAMAGPPVHDGEGGPVAMVLADMAAWFAREGGDPAVVRQAARAMRAADPGRAAVRLVGLACRLQAAGRLPVVRADLGDPLPNRPALVTLRGGLVHLPHEGVFGPRAAPGVVPAGYDAVTKALAGANAPAEEREFAGRVGWAFPEAWWAVKARRWRQRYDSSFYKEST